MRRSQQKRRRSKHWGFFASICWLQRILEHIEQNILMLVKSITGIEWKKYIYSFTRMFWIDACSWGFLKIEPVLTTDICANKRLWAKKSVEAEAVVSPVCHLAIGQKLVPVDQQWSISSYTGCLSSNLCSCWITGEVQIILVVVLKNAKAIQYRDMHEFREQQREVFSEFKMKLADSPSLRDESMRSQLLQVYPSLSWSI